MSLDQLHRVACYDAKSGGLTSFDNFRKRLRVLENDEYLKGDILPYSHEKIYCLGPEALESIRSDIGVFQRSIYKPRGESVAQLVSHPLLVSETAVRFEESARNSDVSLPPLTPHGLPCYHARAVRNYRARKDAARFVTAWDTKVGGRRATIRPDLVFAFQRQGVARLAVVELDRGTEGYKTLARKFRSYAALSKADDYSKRFGDQVLNFRVLFVTTKVSRIEGIVRNVESSCLKPVRFATMESIHDHDCDALTDSVWWRSANGQLVAGCLIAKEVQGVRVE
jgi:hypothetical protein